MFGTKEDAIKHIDMLVSRFKYRKLTPSMSAKSQDLYRETIPDHLNVEGSSTPLFSTGGTFLLSGYDRIVIGDYGAYVEFSEEHALPEFYHLEPGQEFRADFSSLNVKYVWLTPADGHPCKIYKQLKKVDYADYLPGKYYVSVFEVNLG